ncbi:hypothetical protein [Aureimonas sp. AU20]|uniref:hypothetical protein n=1 Tax=Aureimonas sp. AU20 TaxID=1349819 RepID=UPI0007220104|nr:hypothetical protein [Aureimonas sp. AU20]ALN75822.1 hypothetical protein M673_24015 [Aureimonas sp. AU20]
MLFNATPASDTGLPVVTHLGDEPSLSPLALADWCAEIGRTTADVLAVLFKLPAKPSTLALFEAEMREEVGAAIDAITRATDEKRSYLIQVAWVAFDRRLALHRRALPYGGSA